ncbi:hypothetical protein B0H14DRAFT_248824 [Mycena olivaceomarginata]|nr:hypothetical protein B0H14DRAFT_248824 [Mycena olivaceomarginata]
MRVRVYGCGAGSNRSSRQSGTVLVCEATASGVDPTNGAGAGPSYARGRVGGMFGGGCASRSYRRGGGSVGAATEKGGRRRGGGGGGETHGRWTRGRERDAKVEAGDDGDVVWARGVRRHRVVAPMLEAREDVGRRACGRPARRRPVDVESSVEHGRGTREDNAKSPLLHPAFILISRFPSLYSFISSRKSTYSPCLPGPLSWPSS